MIRVSASAFDILWADLCAGPPPGVLDVPSGGRTGAERARIREDVYANLAERGLVPDGRLDPALTERLAVLASAPVTVEGEFLFDLDDPHPLRAVVAARTTGRGVLAVQPQRTIGLAAVGEGREFAEAAAVLPDVEAGPGNGVSLPSTALAAADDPVFGEVSGSRAHERQLREVLAIQARPVLAAGQFSVYRLGAGSGRRNRVGGLTWFLTDVGAYTGVTAPGADGLPWTTVAPADRERVAARLADLARTADTAGSDHPASAAERGQAAGGAATGRPDAPGVAADRTTDSGIAVRPTSRG
ncbi:ESX secretion-associated protein EspG [Prauserella rugosa]|uniref:ESAT-6 protein secretion system EspG family protein n=1 Tax=Prauserella rugosa TaxID=43354 RepID=A0A660CB32_9PSEU|nr:ESAT-6 protein secretion system EspG family protein [Prauserella rugosa]